MAKPRPPRDQNAELRKILGTWVFRYGDQDSLVGEIVVGEHEWTLSRVADRVAYGTLSNGIPITAVVRGVDTDNYFVRWKMRNLCVEHFFNLTSPTTARGTLTLALQTLDGGCGKPQLEPADTFGRRIHAPQTVPLSLQDEAGGWVVYGVMDDDLAPLGGAPRE